VVITIFQVVCEAVWVTRDGDSQSGRRSPAVIVAGRCAGEATRIQIGREFESWADFGGARTEGALVQGVCTYFFRIYDIFFDEFLFDR